MSILSKIVMICAKVCEFVLIKISGTSDRVTIVQVTTN